MNIETLNKEELKGICARSLAHVLSGEEKAALVDDRRFEVYVDRVREEIFEGDRDGMAEFCEEWHYAHESDIIEALSC